MIVSPFSFKKTFLHRDSDARKMKNDQSPKKFDKVEPQSKTNSDDLSIEKTSTSSAF